ATGSALLYSTYLGGSGNEGDYNGYANSNTFSGIAVDGSGNAYVAGFTSSSNFPTTATAFQRAYAGIGDAFVTKLNTTLSGSASLAWSTYLGGSGFAGAHGIAVDGTGNVYVTGSTTEADFPTQNPLANFSGGRNGFLTKLNAAGSALVYST